MGPRPSSHVAAANGRNFTGSPGSFRLHAPPIILCRVTPLPLVSARGTMLTGRGQTRFGTATICSTVLFERRFWTYIVDREGMVYDTRFLAAAAGRSSNVVVY